MKIYYKLKTSMYPILLVHLILIFVTLQIYSILYPEIVQNCLLSVKEAGKKLKESFEKRITRDSNAEFFSPVKKHPLKILSTVVKK